MTDAIVTTIAGPATVITEAGPAGADGATGPQGPQGPSGADGATGPQGPQGPAGVDGADGATGATGPQGPAGSDGATGATGPQGPAGPAGADGATGPQGPQGPSGADGATGSQGPAGPAGPQGATGPQGPAGPAGVDGADGATGPQGPAGQGVPAGGTTGQVLAKSSATDYDTQWVTPAAGGSGGTFQRGATFVNAAGLSLPVNDVPITVPVDCNISEVTVLTAGGTGSCVLDIWRDSYTNYPPTVADTICGASKPTIPGGTKYRDATLTGWTTAIAAGDTLIFKLDSVSGLTLVDITLTLEPT